MKTILFVDDHIPLARLSCEILRREGFRAEFASSAGEALVKFEQGSFDLVVTDYRMEEMNGVELAVRLRQQAPELPIVIVTGCTDVEPYAEVNAWISKQDMFPRLVETIRQLLCESAPAQTSDHN